MEQEVLEIVLKEVLEGQKELTQIAQEMTDKVAGLEEKMKQFDGKMNQQKITVPPVDTRPVEKIVQVGLRDIAAMVEAQPKTVVHKKQFLLFPETNQGEYYRIIFNRLIPWGLAFIVAFYGCRMLGEHIERQDILSERQAENDRYRKAWNYVYSRMGKEKQFMDAMWDDAQKEGN